MFYELFLATTLSGCDWFRGAAPLWGPHCQPKHYHRDERGVGGGPPIKGQTHTHTSAAPNRHHH